MRPSVEAAPGERFDVVVDFAQVPVGTEVTMVNSLGEGSAADVMRFRVVRRARDDSAVPERLADARGARARAPRCGRSSSSAAAGARTPAGRSTARAFDPTTSIADIPLGEVERWRFVTDVHHPVHVHLDAFQVLRRGSGGPGPSDAGWKDTLDLRPAEVVEVAVRFTEHAGRYVLHCHNLEHEDMAMMATIRTV